MPSFSTTKTVATSTATPTTSTKLTIPLIQRCLRFSRAPSTSLESLKRVIELSQVNSAFDECIFKFGTATLLWDAHERARRQQLRDEGLMLAMDSDDDENDDNNNPIQKDDDKDEEDFCDEPNDFPEYYHALTRCSLTPRSIHYTARLREFLIKFSRRFKQPSDLFGCSPLSTRLTIPKRVNGSDDDEYLSLDTEVFRRRRGFSSSAQQNRSSTKSNQKSDFFLEQERANSQSFVRSYSIILMKVSNSGDILAVIDSGTAVRLFSTVTFAPLYDGYMLRLNLQPHPSSRSASGVPLKSLDFSRDDTHFYFTLVREPNLRSVNIEKYIPSILKHKDDDDDENHNVESSSTEFANHDDLASFYDPSKTQAAIENTSDNNSSYLKEPIISSLSKNGLFVLTVNGSWNSFIIWQVAATDSKSIQSLKHFQYPNPLRIVDLQTPQNHLLFRPMYSDSYLYDNPALFFSNDSKRIIGFMTDVVIEWNLTDLVPSLLLQDEEKSLDNKQESENNFELVISVNDVMEKVTRKAAFYVFPRSRTGNLKVAAGVISPRSGRFCLLKTTELLDMKWRLFDMEKFDFCFAVNSFLEESSFGSSLKTAYPFFLSSCDLKLKGGNDSNNKNNTDDLCEDDILVGSTSASNSRLLVVTLTSSSSATSSIRIANCLDHSLRYQHHTTSHTQADSPRAAQSAFEKHCRAVKPRRDPLFFGVVPSRVENNTDKRPVIRLIARSLERINQTGQELTSFLVIPAVSSASSSLPDFDGTNMTPTPASLGLLDHFTRLKTKLLVSSSSSSPLIRLPIVELVYDEETKKVVGFDLAAQKVEIIDSDDDDEY